MCEVVLRVSPQLSEVQEVGHPSPSILITLPSVGKGLRELMFSLSPERDNAGRWVYDLTSLTVLPDNSSTFDASWGL